MGVAALAVRSGWAIYGQSDGIDRGHMVPYIPTRGSGDEITLLNTDSIERDPFEYAASVEGSTISTGIERSADR